MIFFAPATIKCEEEDLDIRHQEIHFPSLRVPRCISSLFIGEQIM